MLRVTIWGKRFRLRVILATTTLLVFLAGQSGATVTTFHSRSAWNAAVGGAPVSDTTFNSFAMDTSFQTTAVNAGAFSLSQVGTEPNDRNYIDVPTLQFGDFDVDGTPVANLFVFESKGLSVSMNFATPVWGFGADFRDADPPFLDLDLVGAAGTTTLSVDVDDRFFGFLMSPTIGITEIIFKGNGNGFAIDNVVSVAVPEPSTFALLGIGLFGLAGYRIGKRVSPSKGHD